MDSAVFRVPRARCRIPNVLTSLGILIFLFVGWALYTALEEEQSLSMLFQTDADSMDRIRAAELLAQKGEAAIPLIRKALHSSESSTRIHGLYAATFMERELARDLQDDVERLCQDENERVRADAIILIADLTDRPGAVASIASVALRSHDGRLVDAGRRALQKLGAHAVPELCRILPQSDPPVRLACLELMGAQICDERVGDAAEAAVMKLLHDTDLVIRRRAFVLLGEKRDFTAEEVAAGLNDADVRIQELAFRYASASSLRDTALLPRLETLMVTVPRVRVLALDAIAGLGPKAAREFDEIWNFTSDRNPAVRRAAARALIAVANWEAARPAMERLLGDADPTTAQRAGELWAEHASAELDSIVRNRLLPRLQSTNKREALSAAAALAGMPKAAFPVRGELIRLLNRDSANGSTRLAIQLAEALGNMGPSAREAAPAITGLIQRLAPWQPNLAVPITALAKIGATDPLILETLVTIHENRAARNPRTREALLFALGELGRDDRGICELLFHEATAGSRFSPLRIAALRALGKNRVDRDLATETISTLLGDDNPHVRYTACALLAGQENAEVFVPKLADCLQDECTAIRLLAARTLERLGPRGSEALPLLQEALRDADNALPVSMTDEDGIYPWLLDDLPSPRHGTVRAAIQSAITAIRSESKIQTVGR